MWFISIIILIAFLIILMIDDLIKTEQLHAKQYELDVIEKEYQEILSLFRIIIRSLEKNSLFTNITLTVVIIPLIQTV